MTTSAVIPFSALSDGAEVEYRVLGPLELVEHDTHDQNSLLVLRRLLSATIEALVRTWARPGHTDKRAASPLSKRVTSPAGSHDERAATIR